MRVMKFMRTFYSLLSFNIFFGGGCFLWQSKLREPEMEAEMADRKTAGASIMSSHTKLHHDSNSGSQTSHLSCLPTTCVSPNSRKPMKTSKFHGISPF